ncbi:MAG: DUF2470 domain-containing protein [Actinomycetota bacterium]
MTQRPSQHAVPDAGTGEGSGSTETRPAGPAPAEPSHAERCRTLVASSSRGALCTLAVEPGGYPYGSVASYAIDGAGNPLLFLSRMAQHTQNALGDPRASLLVSEPVPDGSDPLAVGRVTLLGLMAEVGPDERADTRARYLEAVPTASYYIDFGDFTFFRLSVGSIRYVGGYGRMSWVEAAAYASARPDPLAGAAAAAIVGHMNADHAEAQVLLCRHQGGRPSTAEATMSAVDSYGFEMVAAGPEGRSAVRLAFPEPCTTPDEVRRAMVAMVGEARRQLSPASSPGA